MVINCKILEDYLNYISVIKARSHYTLLEYKLDMRLLFLYVWNKRNPNQPEPEDCSFADINFIKSITLDDMYGFIGYCKDVRNCTVQTRSRKIISIRQFWKYLETKAHLIENNITEELEVPKQAKRMPQYLSLEDSIRLLMSVENLPRNYCIVTLFLNCALRLAELVNMNVEQISAQSVTVIGKGDKERQIYLTPAAKAAVNAWLVECNNYNPKDNALFISNRGIRLTTRSIQIVIKNAVDKAGLSQDITPHKLRHTAATLLYKHGHVDIRALK